MGLVKAKLLLKRSFVEGKRGKYRQALRWAARARKAVRGLDEREAVRQAAQSTSWYATVLLRDIAVTAMPLFAQPEELVGAMALFWEHGPGPMPDPGG